jgi:hypothetical protein
VIAPNNEGFLNDRTANFGNVTILDGVKLAKDIGFTTRAPILPDFIVKALPLIETPLVALINADIMITPEFSKNLGEVIEKHGYSSMYISCRKNISLDFRADSDVMYQKAMALDRRVYDSETSSDLFITSKYWWKRISQEVPQFILGRLGFDNWLHMYAEIIIKSRFNCSSSLPTLHCDHDDRYIASQEKTRKRSDMPSNKYNLDLWEDWRGRYGTVRVNNWPSVELPL